MKNCVLNQDILHASLQVFLQQLTEYEFTAGNAVAVGNEQGTILELYNGFADLENAVPISEQTIYRMFSLTKPITALSTMQLLEKGRISLDDPVSKYLSEYDNVRVWHDGRAKKRRM